MRKFQNNHKKVYNQAHFIPVTFSPSHNYSTSIASAYCAFLLDYLDFAERFVEKNLYFPLKVLVFGFTLFHLFNLNNFCG